MRHTQRSTYFLLKVSFPGHNVSLYYEDQYDDYGDEQPQFSQSHRSANPWRQEIHGGGRQRHSSGSRRSPILQRLADQPPPPQSAISFSFAPPPASPYRWTKPGFSPPRPVLEEEMEQSDSANMRRVLSRLDQSAANLRQPPAALPSFSFKHSANPFLDPPSPVAPSFAQPAEPDPRRPTEVKPKQLGGKTGGKQPVMYSEETALTATEMEAFEADQFLHLANIPLKPPPRSLCR